MPTETGNNFSRSILLFLSCIIGALLIPRLSINLNPSIKQQNIAITYTYPGANAASVENEVTAKLESAFATLRNLEQINSRSSEGQGSINLVFSNKQSIESIRLEVVTLVRQVYKSLPTACSFPRVNYQYNTEKETKLLTYNLSSSLAPEALEALVKETFIVPLSKQIGVDQVMLTGIQKKEWQVSVDRKKAQILDIDFTQIETTITNNITARNLDLTRLNDHRKYTLRFLTHPDHLNAKEALESIVVGRINKRPIYLSELATIQLRTPTSETHYRVNGQAAIILAIFPDQRVNQIELARRLRTEVMQRSRAIKDQLEVTLIQDYTAYLSTELKKIAYRTLLSFGVLLLFIGFVYPNWRYLLLLFFSLVACLLMANICYYFLKVELHLFSIAGWTLSLGIILDNLVIMADGIKHRTRQPIFLAILAATLTSIVVLSVVFFVDKDLQWSLIDFSWVFCINLLVSLLYALVFLPELATFLKVKKQKKSLINRKRIVIRFGKIYTAYIRFLVKRKWIAYLFLLFSFGIPLFLLPERLDGDQKWKLAYNQSIGSEFYLSKVRPWLDVGTGGFLKAFIEQNERFDFRPTEKKEIKLYLEGQIPFGGTTEQLNTALQQIEGYLEQYKEIKHHQTSISGPYNSRLEITFHAAYQKSFFPEYLKGELEQFANSLGGVDFRIYGVGRSFDNTYRGDQLTDFVRLSGFNYPELFNLARMVKDSLELQPRIKEVFISSERSFYSPTEKYFLVDLPEENIAFQNKLTKVGFSKKVKELVTDRGSFGQIQGAEIRLLSRDQGLNDLWQLQNQLQANNTGSFYRNEQFLNLMAEAGKLDVIRKNQQYEIILQYNFLGENRIATRVLEKELAKIRPLLPMGYQIMDLNQYDRKKEGSWKMVMLVFFALFLILFISGILFNSLRQAIIPVFLIFPSYIGRFISVLLLPLNFDLGGFASFLLVAGLSVNGVLFIINDFNNQNKKYPDRTSMQHYLKAFNTKIVPVLIASISTVLGLIPFFLFDQGALFWYALAIGSIGGLLCSVLAIVLFLPAFFLKQKGLEMTKKAL